MNNYAFSEIWGRFCDYQNTKVLARVLKPFDII